MISLNAIKSTTCLFMRQNGPTIAFAAGSTMVAGGSVLAVAKSLKRKYGEDGDMTVTEVHEYYKNVRGSYEYNKQELPETADECNRAIRKTYIDEIKFYGKTYWLPLALVLGGYALSIGAYAAMGLRLAAMTSAYTKLAASNAALLKAGENKLLPNNAEEIVIPEGAYTSNPNYDIDPSAITGMPYSYWYTSKTHNGKHNPRWTNSMDSNFTGLACCFERLNQRFHNKGYMYLNEILETYAIALAPEGYQVGYIYSLTEDVQNQIDYYATAYIIEDGVAKVFDGDQIPEGADVRIALTLVPDGAIDHCVYSRLFKTL